MPFTKPARRLLPRSLLARLLLIILLPLVLVQLVAFTLFYGTHLNSISRRFSGALASELAYLSDRIDAASSPATRDIIIRDSEKYFELRMRFQPSAELLGQNSQNIFGPMDDDLTIALAQHVGHAVITDWIRDPQFVLIDMQLKTGVLHVEVPRKRLYPSTIYLFVVWLVGSAALLFGIAAAFMRNQVRAIRRLTTAVEAFGLGRDPEPLQPEGAAEVRRAAIAFNRMQERIRRFMTQRTEMLAGVSHDLRTPLTRMKLALAMLPRDTRDSADIAEITIDIQDMETLIETYLAFARGEQEEQAEMVDFSALLANAVSASKRAGVKVTLHAPKTLMLNLRPGAIRRVIANLLDNAGRHAKHVELTAAQQGRQVVMLIDDDGPGIAPSRREEVFRPFESSAAGGTGLGLTIARDIVRAHGGDILLEDSPRGGLRARVTLPV